ncbi:hypothetical protein QBC41DRAFT_326516 [Cercophora samala]|uniref:Uncharacterized protein n=1 Tax=Cercophora samala TaxID=330535 RepID=A0AA40D7H4_9PEZI|nr:hypothetical protein QBC41DRAFT_326516 [Cercophora samala]
MPTTTLSRLPQQQQADVSVPSSVPEKRVKSPYRHRTFSFESPPASPELVVLPNQGGLDIATLSSSSSLSRGDLSQSVHHPHIRSTSSTYPSEGAQSPELSASSPPVTFGRRILDSLEAYGFSSAHLEILQSEEEEERLRRLTEEEQETEKEGKGLEGLYPGEKRLSPEEAGIAKAISTARSPGPKKRFGRWTSEGEEGGGFVLPAPESPVVPLLTEHTILVSDGNNVGEGEDNGADENASTRCLPRVSTALSFPSFDGEHLSSIRLQEEEEEEGQEHVSFGTQLKEKISGHFRRGHYRSSSRLGTHGEKGYGGGGGGGEEEKTRVTADVKRWLVRGFKAGRKGVRKVKRGLHHHHQGDGGRKAKLKKEMKEVDLKLERERGKLRKKPRRESAMVEKEGKGKREGLRGRIWGLWLV